MKLLIDAGNTRLKWAVIHGRQWIADGIVEYSELAQLHEIARTHAIDDAVALAVNVAGENTAHAISEALSHAGLHPQWLPAGAERCGVRNLYEQPTQLGADRWAALIGARALHRGASLVVSAGTATTIDLLSAGGDFLGGLILPGEDLMRHALAHNTAQLPLSDGKTETWPRNTGDAIVTGCLYAQAGAIERAFSHIAHEPDARCLLAGGNAARIQPLLGIPCQRADNLVLRGLARIANEAAPGCTDEKPA